MNNRTPSCLYGLPVSFNNILSREPVVVTIVSSHEKDGNQALPMIVNAR